MNGLVPNVSEYSQTLPFFVCQEWGNQCVAGCGNFDASCASDCRQNHPCGALDPSPPNKTATQTLGATASGGEGSKQTAYNGFADGSGGGDQSGASSLSALSMGQSFGLPVVMGALVLGFAIGL